MPPARTAARASFSPGRSLFLPVTLWSTLIRPLGDAQTRKCLAVRCQVLFVGGDLGVAGDLRGQVQLSRLSNLSGTVLRAGVLVRNGGFFTVRLGGF